MGTTAWAIGSHPTVGAVQIRIDVDGGGSEILDVVTEESPLYLYDGGSGSFDAMFLLQEAIREYTGADAAGTVVRLTRDRKVQIIFQNEAQDVQQSTEILAWLGTGADAFTEMLGFTGTEVATHGDGIFTAPETSPYLWSPNAIETSTMARRGEIGAPYFDTAVGMSATRQVVATTNNSGSANHFLWHNVINARYWSASAEWGEYYIWWHYVQRQFRKFKLWIADELDASTDAATITEEKGPYVYRWNGDDPLSFPFHREIEFLETLHMVELPVIEVDEYE